MNCNHCPYASYYYLKACLHVRVLIQRCTAFHSAKLRQQKVSNWTTGYSQKILLWHYNYYCSSPNLNNRFSSASKLLFVITLVDKKYVL